MLLSEWDGDTSNHDPSRQTDLRMHSHMPERGEGTLHAGLARAFTPAEDMGIVLLETAHPGETLQSAAVLISVQHTKVSQSQGKLSVRSRSACKHHAVPCICACMNASTQLF